MKNIRRIVSIALVFVLIISCAFAEWKADIISLMPAEEAPDFAEIVHELNMDESATKHVIACQITVNSVQYGCEFEFRVSGNAISDWTPVQTWLGGIVTSVASTAGGDAQSLAKEMDSEIAKSIRGEATNTDKPVWATDQLKLKRLTISSPFYSEISAGSSGSGTRELQERLIVLGFMDSTADGVFGEKTRVAIVAAENYVRMLEEEKIEEHLLDTPEPTEVARATSTPSPTPTAEPTPSPVPTHELLLIPKETRAPAIPIATATPEITEEPTVMPVAEDANKPQPQTKVDGKGDALLQAYLFSWNFPTVHIELEQGMKNLDVSRLQTRLNNLGYLAEEVDGIYGVSTENAVAYFQRCSGLPETGDADTQTQKALFSVSAVSSPYRALSEGMKGDEVEELQKKLKVLGFTSSGADGTFGPGTKSAVQSLQKYLNETTGSTYAENGIADPALLDYIYSDEFSNGSGSISDGDKGTLVSRVQRRLSALGYLEGTADGMYGSATTAAISWFQRQHKLTETGTADQATMDVLFSDKATKALKPYVLLVSIADQRVYAYGLDENNQYTVLVKTMVCSTGKSGSDTPKGVFESTTGPGARWHFFTKFNCWAQYAYYIQGDIMFHSVLYKQKEGKVTQSSVNNLGRRASHGCVRLAVEDAKWIWVNCPKGTKVTVQ